MPLEMISERDFPQFTELEALHDFLKCFKKHAPREETCTEELHCEERISFGLPGPRDLDPASSPQIPIHLGGADHNGNGTLVDLLTLQRLN